MVIEVQAVHHRFCPKCGYSATQGILGRHAWVQHRLSLFGMPTEFAHSSFDMTFRAGGRFFVHDVVEPRVADLRLCE